MRTTAALLERSGAARPYAVSQPLQLATVELDSPQPGELLVRIDAAGLCHSDLSVINGDRPRPLPMALGHEAVATVLEVGGLEVKGLEPGHAQDRRLAAGDRVVLSFLPACGECALCVSGEGYMCPNGAAANGRGELLRGGSRLHRCAVPGCDVSGSEAPRQTINHHLGVSAFASLAVIDARSAVKIDKDIPVEIAALFGCAVLTGVGAVLNSANLRLGESVVVYGLGGVGLSAVLGALAAGGVPVVAVDPLQAKRELAVSLGAKAAFDPQGAEGKIIDLLGCRPDVAIETVGNARVLETAYGLVRRGGRVVTVGLPHPSQMFSIPASSLVGDGKAVIGSYLGSSIPARDIPRYIALWQAGRLPVDRLLSGVGTLQDINRMFDELASGEAIRQVIIP